MSSLLVLQRVALGEESAFRECLSTYGRLVYGICRKFLRDGRDVEEATQDIFIALWKSASAFDPERGTEATFIAMIARRRIVDRQRAARARLVTVANDDESGTPELPVPATMESYVDARLAADALAELGEDQRKVILLAAMQGMTHDEISKELSIPLGTVKSHYARGIERVKRALEKAKS